MGAEGIGNLNIVVEEECQNRQCGDVVDKLLVVQRGLELRPEGRTGRTEDVGGHGSSQLCEQDPNI